MGRGVCALVRDGIFIIIAQTAAEHMCVSFVCVLEFGLDVGRNVGGTHTTSRRVRGAGCEIKRSVLCARM